MKLHSPYLDVDRQKVTLDYYRLSLSKRKTILAVNSPDSIKLEKFTKLFQLFKIALQFEKDKNLMQALTLYNEIIEKNEYFIKPWEGLERIYNSLGENDKREKALERIRFISNIIDFETNAAKKINLQHLQLHNLGFYGNGVWEFQPQINILLGKNGFGKSHLLRLLISLLQGDDISVSSYFFGDKNGAFTELSLDRDQKDKVIHFVKSGFKESIGKVPILAIPDMRFFDKSKTSVGYMEEERSDLREYGAYHFLYNKPYEAIIQNFLFELCIKYMDGGKSFDIPVFQLLHGVVRELVDTGFQFHQITPMGNAKFEIKVITEGNENNPLPIQQASQGTLSVLAIFGLIYEYLNNLHQGESSVTEDILKKSGIVFIDELDAHLHPTWQRKMINLLRDNFPNVQFFVTAHSPLVVAGCFAGEAAVLRKGKDGFVVENLDQDFIGYETKDLFHKIFEVEDKDENYLLYTAMSPFVDEIEQEIVSLEKKRKESELTIEEEQQLKKFYNDLDHINTALAKSKNRYKYEKLSIENRKLKVENLKLLRKISGTE